MVLKWKNACLLLEMTSSMWVGCQGWGNTLKDHVVSVWHKAQVSVTSQLAGSGFPRCLGTCWGYECQECSYLHLLLSYLCSTQKNKLNDI